MRIAVKDINGQLYTNDMSDNNKHVIIEMHFCTSYTQIIVQDTVEEGEKTIYPTKNVIVPLESDTLDYALDMMAITDDEIGEWA